MVQDFLPEPTQAPAPNGNGASTSDANQKERNDDPENVPLKDEPMYGNDHSGDTAPSWNAGQANGGNAHQYNDAVMEQEPAPIGIKEDG